MKRVPSVVDEGGYAEGKSHECVEIADEERRSGSDGKAEPRIEAVLGDEDHGHHRPQCEHRAHRQVELARDHEERRAERDQPELRHDGQDHAHVPLGHEALAAEAEPHGKRDRNNDRGDLGSRQQELGQCFHGSASGRILQRFMSHDEIRELLDGGLGLRHLGRLLAAREHAEAGQQWGRRGAGCA